MSIFIDPHPNICPSITLAVTWTTPEGEIDDSVREQVMFGAGQYERDEWFATSERVRWAIDRLTDEGINASTGSDPTGADFESADDYVDPFTGRRERKHARLLGFHPHERAQVYEAITGRLALNTRSQRSTR